MSKASGAFLLAFFVSLSLYGQNLTAIRVLNSPYDEQHAVLSPYGDIVYSVGYHPSNTGGVQDAGDIWISLKDNKGAWNKPSRVAALSSTSLDVPLGFLSENHLLVYHGGSVEKAQGIYHYTFNGRVWTLVEKLKIRGFINSSPHFSGRLHGDGKILIMSLQDQRSLGNEDLYISTKGEDGWWSTPQNLGSQVNSQNQEITPFLSKDGRSLYFSSNRTSGKHIFKAVKSGNSWNEWSQPELVESLNSDGVETGFMIMPEGHLAIYSTTMNSEGFGDFAMVLWEDRAEDEEIGLVTTEPVESIEEMENTQQEEKNQVLITIENPAFLPVLVLDFSTKVPLEFEIQLIGKSGEFRSTDQSVIFGKLTEGDWFSVFVNAVGYIPIELNPEAWMGLQGKELLLKPAVAGVSIVLENISFNRGTADFADSRSILVLDKLVDFLEKNPGLKIRLEGHTDNVGDPSLNKELSTQRASRIRGYLTIKGIAFERIRVIGQGGSRPIADNSTEAGREKNRRVEMILEQ